jgi:ABC-type Zn2+ transport system substrate-binding protein/surface adhesin
MQQAGSITIMAHDEPAAQLLSCLRENVRELKVEIAEPDGNHVWITDHSGSVASLPDLLEERLDQCGQTLGISDWQEHLRVDPQQPAT